MSLGEMGEKSIEDQVVEACSWLLNKINEQSARLDAIEERVNKLETRGKKVYGVHLYDADTTAIPQFAKRAMEEMKEEEA